MTTLGFVPYSNDPFGYRDELSEARSDPDLGAAVPDAARAAFRVALALGRCRLYGIDPGPVLGEVLTPEMAATAARDLTGHLVNWTAEAEQLAERWDSAIDPAEADEFCGRLLGIRMDAWAAGIAIDEAYVASGAESLGQAIDVMQDAIDRFDDRLQERTDVLATLAGTRRLDNWREPLAERYREDLPWWLDGRLEETAHRIEQEAMQTMPGPRTWSRVRRLVEQKRGNSVSTHPVLEEVMSNQAIARGFLLELAAEGIAPVVGGCAGAMVAGPAGAAGGAVVGRVVEKAINFFGPKIVGQWLDWFRGKPKNEQVEAVASLSVLSVEQAKEIAGPVLDRLAPSASLNDKALALEFISAIPDVVQQSLVLDVNTGANTVPSRLSLESPQSLLQLLPTDAPPYSAPTQLPGTPYFLKRVVGTGGFGVVYEAEAPALQHLPLAIKFCLDAAMLDMLRRERDNLERLMVASATAHWSPQIVKFYGSSLEHKTPFLVYEFVPGGNLANHLAKRRAEIGGNLSADEVLGLIRQITEALAFAHERGLVHRDLKPANILVHGTTLKLADFGIGGIVAGHAAAHSQIGRSMINQLHADEQVSLLRGSGTPLYMDPEQRLGVAPNPKHDLYSLGVVWYQLLVGNITRELHGGWEEELSDEFEVPETHIEMIKRCVSRKNRPKNARELLALLLAPRLLGNGSLSNTAAAKVALNSANPAPSVRTPEPAVSPNRRRKVNWQQLLAVLQQRVGPGQVTTYGECSQWAFFHRGGGQSIRAMLEAAARRGNHVWTNRVVFDDGSCGAADQAYGQSAQLRAEGVPFIGHAVDLNACRPVEL